MDIIKILQEELGIRRGQVETTIKLIDEGNTIPFIARYRKEMTGSLDDETLRNFHERLLYLRNLEERKEAIKKNIEEQGKLTKLIYKVQPLVKSMGVIPNLVGVPMGGIEAESLFNEKLMLLRLRNNLARPVNRWIKTIFDYVLTITGTIVILPILIIIALWIYKDSPGPVIFKHRRIGKTAKNLIATNSAACA